ncbi:hypothetical protein ACSSS7_006430 [Eimeria intestinalis]
MEYSVMPWTPGRQQPPTDDSPADEGSPPEGPTTEGSSEAQRSSCLHVHEIRPADTLLSIAAQYDVPVQELMQLNRLTSSDIWYHRHLIIPCRHPSCLSSLASSSSAPSGGELPHSSGSSDRSSNTQRVAPRQSGQQPSASRAFPRMRREVGARVSSVQQAPARAQGSEGPVEGPHKGTLSEAVQESANLAMLVEALDCLELRRWAAELDLTAPEILAYLIMHGGDLPRAHTALIEDLQWHKKGFFFFCIHVGPGLRDNTRRMQMLQGDLNSSFSWLPQFRLNFLRGFSRGRYRRLPSDNSLNASWGGPPPVHPGVGLHPAGLGCPPLSSARGTPSGETARRGPFPFPQAEGGSSTLLHFNSTSVEALRRRPIGRGQREGGGGPQGPHEGSTASSFSAPVARGAPPTPAVGAPVPESEEEGQEGKGT